MNDYNKYFDDNLYLEVYSLTNNETIKFPILHSKYFKDCTDDDYEDVVTPFTTYYYSALSLLISNDDEKQILFKYIEMFEMVWVLSNCNNLREYRGAVKEWSQQIKQAFYRIKEVNNKSKFHILLSSFAKEKYEQIKLEYNNWKQKNEQIDKKIKQGRSCVAIVMPIKNLKSKENCFLSVSGASKDYDGTKFTKNIAPDIKQAYKAINDLLENLYGFRFIECHLCDDTRRYTFFDSRKNFNRNTTDGRPLKHPIKYEKDYVLRHHRPNFNAHYSCCERKIINYMKFVNKDYKKLMHGINPKNKLSEYEFRIIKEPCRMCRPALIGCSNILFNFDDCLKLIYGYKNPKTIILNPSSNMKEPYIVK